MSGQDAAVTAIFADAQRSLATHRTSMKKILELLEKTTSGSDSATHANTIVDAILHGCVDRALVCAKKEPSVDRVIKFFCEVVVGSMSATESSSVATGSSTGSDWFFAASINHLLIRTTTSNKTVRFRACEVIAGIMAGMKAETEVSDEMFTSMVKFLAPRLRDKAPNVRFWAIKAVGRLQNPQDDDDIVLSELIRIMASDTSKDARVAAVENVCICKKSLPALVERIKDIKSEVRVAALEHMAKDIDIR